MKKALLVANLGGFASFLLSDIDILRKRGYEIVYAANGSCLAWEDTKAELVKRNVKFVHVEFHSQKPMSKQNIQAFNKIRNLLKHDHFELIHCHTPIASLITRLAAVDCRRRGTRVLYTSHGLAFTERSSWKTRLVYRTMEDIGSRLCDGIITINRADYEQVKKMHCPKVFYIHGVGVDTACYRDISISRDAYRASINVQPHDIMVLSVGELSTRKNHQVIIEAISQVVNKQRYVYVICGNGINGGTGQKLLAMAKEKNVRLNLLGFRWDIPELTKCSDIGAIPSVREGLGLAGIQSLAAGVPLVGSNVQGICDYIEEGKTGFLCDPYDSKAFAASLEKIANLTKGERNAMERQCSEVSQKFDIEISKKERLEIYDQFLF